MATRPMVFASMLPGFLACVAAAPAFAGEPDADHWNKTAAVGYLDSRGQEWFNFGGAHGAGEARPPRRASVATACSRMHWPGPSCGGSPTKGTD